MGVVAVITYPHWLDVLQRYGCEGEVNFWRPGHVPFPESYIGTPFVFVRKGSEPRKVMGYGVFRRTEFLTIEEAWKKWGRRNGVVSLNDFMERLGLLSESTATNRGSLDSDPPSPNRVVQCVVLSDVVLFPEKAAPTASSVFCRYGGLHRNTVSYKRFPDASLSDLFGHRGDLSSDSPGVILDARSSPGVQDEEQCIQARALEILEQLFQAFHIEDASTSSSGSPVCAVEGPGYDFKLTLGDWSLHVQLRGSKSYTGSVKVTMCDLMSGHECPNTLLLVVSGIETDFRDGTWVAKGGKPSLYRWRNTSVLVDLVKEAQAAGLSPGQVTWTIENPDECPFLERISPMG